jgi:hypothetical protein
VLLLFNMDLIFLPKRSNRLFEHNLNFTSLLGKILHLQYKITSNV